MRGKTRLDPTRLDKPKTMENWIQAVNVDYNCVKVTNGQNHRIIDAT